MEQQRQESYQALMEKANQLIREANRLKEAERQQIIADIRAKMKAHGITIQEIQSGTRRSRIRMKGEPVYRDPASNRTWTGMGRMPNWIKEAMANGASLDSFKI